MAKIQILDKHTAELIAAGEVVERPASVAKELLENAVDAGADQITLSIRGGGIEELQIIDNGCGIEKDSLSNAFVRHATSKIVSKDDLSHIHTLGFRGEALASIASVARVELLTCTALDEYASLYRIEGGVPLGVEPSARPVGTTITVRDLFYNTPARMKFLKKDASEGAFVSETVQHISLSHPEISFRFLRDGKLQFLTPGDADLRSAVYAALGREFARDLLAVNSDSAPYSVKGLITPPRAGRGSRSAQHFFVNGRYVKNRTMMAALENAYKGILMQGRFPGAVLLLTMPTEWVDVNVHPAKTEVRFVNESAVFEAVYGAVRAALAAPGSGTQSFSLGPQNVARQDSEIAKNTVTAQPQKHFSDLTAQQYRSMMHLDESTPSEKSDSADRGASVACAQGSLASPGLRYRSEQSAENAAALEKALDSAAESLLDILPDLPEAQSMPTAQVGQTPAELLLLDGPGPAALPDGEQTTFTPRQQAVGVRLVGEAFKTYILIEYGDALCIIDKHAAHERILYEKLAKNYGEVPSQMLLKPVPVRLAAEEKEAVLQNLDVLHKAGIEVEDFGDSTVLVRSVPADAPPQESDVGNLLAELAQRLSHGEENAVSRHTEWLLHSIACHAAIKGGDSSHPEELVKLAKEILDGKIPPFCPHGRPCLFVITRRDLEKQFGRRNG